MSMCIYICIYIYMYIYIHIYIQFRPYGGFSFQTFPGKSAGPSPRPTFWWWSGSPAAPRVDWGGRKTPENSKKHGNYIGNSWNYK